MKTKHFCSCKDFNCKLHPSNHNLGCDPCISHNLKNNEIPVCFFLKIHHNIKNQKSFKFKDFCDFLTLYNKQ